MTRILTIVAGVQSDMDEAVVLAFGLVDKGVLELFADGDPTQPAPEMGNDAIQVACPSEHWQEARKAFHDAGFSLVGDE